MVFFAIFAKAAGNKETEHPETKKKYCFYINR